MKSRKVETQKKLDTYRYGEIIFSVSKFVYCVVVIMVG